MTRTRDFRVRYHRTHSSAERSLLMRAVKRDGSPVWCVYIGDIQVPAGMDEDPLVAVGRIVADVFRECVFTHIEEVTK